MIGLAKVSNPFPGLRPFKTEEYNLFFGREGQADELLSRLRRTRFLAVVGTSGSGKSSLIKAGLLPALYGGLLEGAGSSWRVAVFRPGNDPIGELAHALNREAFGHDGGDADIRDALTETTLRRSSLGLVEAVREARLSAHESVLVVADQFEELFRFKQLARATGAEDDAAAFVKLLLGAAHQREVPVYVVLTMRSDFLGDCAQFRDLPEAINESQYLIPRMTRDERSSAITGPAAVGGGRVSAPLVNRLLNDMGDNPDQLPILQHALMRTWDHWSARRRDSEPVTVDDYEDVGAMEDALSRHAEEAFGELDERLRLVAERVFKALTEKGADNREVRRPTRLAELCAVAAATEEEVRKVVDVFRPEGRTFLMPPEGTELEPDTVIDISHESLIRNWERLREWVKDEADAARIYRRLADAAAFGDPLTGSSLETALEWRARHVPNAAWAERYAASFGLKLDYAQVNTFIDESKRRHDAQAKAEADRLAAEEERKRRELEQAQKLAEEQQRLAESESRRAEEQSRSARRFRWLTVGLAVVVLLALAAAVYAYRQKLEATASLNRATDAEREATRALDKVRQAEQELQLSNESLKAQYNEAKAAKAEAEKQKAEAEKQKAEAEKQTRLAVAASREAEQQAALARQSESKARGALAKAGEEAKRANEQAARARQQEHIANEQAKLAAENAEKAQKALKDSEALLDRERLNRNALAHMMRFEMEEADQKFLKVEGLYSDQNAEGLEGRAWTLYNRGELRRRLGQHDRAADFFLEALQTLDAKESLRSVKGQEAVGFVRNLAEALRDAKKYESAVERYKQVLDALGPLDLRRSTFFNLNVARQHQELAEVYVEIAKARKEKAEGARPAAPDYATYPDATLENPEEQAKKQYRLALNIWDRVLPADKAALAQKYDEASRFFDQFDKPYAAEISKKADELSAAVKAETARAAGGQDPVNASEVSTALPAEGPGFTTYGREPGGADQYGTAPLIEAVLAIGKAWESRHRDIKLAVGDLSRKGGGPFPPHSNHRDGREVDFRPLALDGQNQPTNIYAVNYSHDLTRELVTLIRQMFPNAIISFNDPYLVKDGLTKRASGNENHIHVRFP